LVIAGVPNCISALPFWLDFGTLVVVLFMAAQSLAQRTLYQKSGTGNEKRKGQEGNGALILEVRQPRKRQGILGGWLGSG
jgi:hypothetical protein